MIFSCLDAVRGRRATRAIVRGMRRPRYHFPLHTSIWRGIYIVTNKNECCGRGSWGRDGNVSYASDSVSDGPTGARDQALLVAKVKARPAVMALLCASSRTHRVPKVSRAFFREPDSRDYGTGLAMMTDFVAVADMMGSSGIGW